MKCILSLMVVGMCLGTQVSFSAPPIVDTEEDVGTFVCGVYIIRGKLIRGEEGGATLALMAETRSHMEVPLFDLSLENKTRFWNRYLEIKVRIFEEGSAMEAAMEAIGRPKPITEEESYSHPQKLLKKERCAD